MDQQKCKVADDYVEICHNSSNKQTMMTWQVLTAATGIKQKVVDSRISHDSQMNESELRQLTLQTKINLQQTDKTLNDWFFDNHMERNTEYNFTGKRKFPDSSFPKHTN